MKLPRPIVRAATLAALLAASACGSSGGGGGPPAGNLEILAKGGTGLNGVGGTGGGITIKEQSGSDVLILRSGQVDTSFTVPGTLPDLGTNTATIGAPATITVTGSTIPGDGGGVATGLHVLPGVTLTLVPSAGDTIDISFDAGVRIDGTLRVGKAVGLPDTAHLTLDARDAGIAIGPAGRIDVSGEDDLAGDGAEAGTRTLRGAVLNRGTIDASGGDGLSGGQAAEVVLDTSGNAGGILNLGTIVTSGGAASSGLGGAGARAILRASPSGLGGVFNQGSITTRGGDGSAGGGEGGEVLLESNDLGPCVNAGTIDASGGNATGAGAGAGGISRTVDIIARGGSLRVAGTLRARGGTGAGGAGGRGGDISILNGAVATVMAQFADAMEVGAAIDASGGDGATGGDGGSAGIRIERAGTVVRGAEPLLLLGYGRIDYSGGDGTGGRGGDAGSLGRIFHVDATSSAGPLPVVGGVVNEADWVTRGGAGTDGGLGGEIRFTNDSADVSPQRAVRNFGALDARGGDAMSAGGPGGSVFLRDLVRVENFGSIDNSSGRNNGDNGSFPGPIQLQSPGGVVVNSADIRSDGGPNPTGSAVRGGSILLSGVTVSTAGTITARGGDTVSGTAAGGGSVTIASSTPPSAVRGLLHVGRGAGGAVAATNGTVTIDGVPQTLGPDGSISF